MASEGVPGELIHVITVTGRIHRAYRYQGRLLVDERCNLDDAQRDAGRLTQIIDISDASPAQLCHRCFPTTKTE